MLLKNIPPPKLPTPRRDKLPTNATNRNNIGHRFKALEQARHLERFGKRKKERLIADIKLCLPNSLCRIERIFNYKYPAEYIAGFDTILERKKRIGDFYGRNLDPETTR